ncbi:MAG: hypothetical protein Q9191_001750 [Dirinaria sp. TL-2023a]
MDSMRAQKVVVVGAGPVGALAALYAAGRGDEVEIYELRSDLRDPTTTPLNFTRSINLALSERGINSMRNAKSDGLLESVLQETIPMHGRMIHGRGKDGHLFQEPQAYDARGRYIRAVDRAGLNKRLLDALEKLPNVRFFFGHKLTGANFNSNTAWFERREASARTDHAQNPTQDGKQDSDRPKELSVKFDLLIGADGAHSAARYHMMKYARLSYQQEYIDTLWCEFKIEPKQPNGSFAISPNHLHIWPAGSFMFIAIPSLDQSFTCTLFAPSSHFESLSAHPDRELEPFFEKYFPGVCPGLIASTELQKQFKENPHLPLISIKCTPYHYKSSAVILGDAAHAMVPFYGQGMNAGLEDVRVLFDILDSHEVYSASTTSIDQRKAAREGALAKYTDQRTPDAFAINDLALQNYEEMRSSVTSHSYKLRKYVEEKLSVHIPASGFSTQYTRVSFENQRYSDVEKAVANQTRLLVGGLATVMALLGGLGWMSFLKFGVQQSRWISLFRRR